MKIGFGISTPETYVFFRIYLKNKCIDLQKKYGCIVKIKLSI